MKSLIWLVLSGCTEYGMSSDPGPGCDSCLEITEILQRITVLEAATSSPDITVTRLDVGSIQCPQGGIQIHVGVQTENVCNGTNGLNGTDGLDGLDGVDGSTGHGSGMVVTEYEIDCAETDRFMPPYYIPYSNVSGDPRSGFHLVDRTEMVREALALGLSGYDYENCITAKIDPLDPPFEILVSTTIDSRLANRTYDRAAGISAWGWDNYLDIDLRTNFGNRWDWNWQPQHGPDTGSSNHNIHADGWVVHRVNDVQYDCSHPIWEAPTNTWKCERWNTSARVVIYDDKPALKPEDW